MTVRRALAAILLGSVTLLTTAPVGVAVTTEASFAPAATTDGGTGETLVRSRPIVATKRIVVAKRKDGLRITTRLEGPLVAGQATRARTTVRNVGEKPISWDLGINGLGVGARMTEASWRTGKPIVELPAFGSPEFFAARNDLKVDLAGEMSPIATRIWLPFELRKVDGVPVASDGLTVPATLRPGERIDFVHEWDGYTGLSGGLAGSGGLPPSGGVRISVTAWYTVDDPPIDVARAQIDTTVVGGWDEERLHPLEVVDAALADPAFAQLMEEADFLRYDTGYITYVPGSDRWYVGSCGRPEGAEIQYWRLGTVDPVSGEVLEFVEGFGNETCDPGTWPVATATGDGESDPEDLLATYATLPVADSLTSAGSPFRRLWRPFEPADIPFRYRCGTEDTFTATDLAAASPVANAADLLADAIRHWGGWLGGSMDWHVVNQLDDRVLALAPTFGGGSPLDELELVKTITDGPGYETWDFVGGGDCRPEAVLGRGIAGRWRLDPRFPAPGPKTRTLRILGYAGCNGTEKAGPARIHTTEEAMLIAIPMHASFNSDACSGLGPTRMTVRLPEPLGQRALYDAGSLPIRQVGRLRVGSFEATTDAR